MSISNLLQCEFRCDQDAETACVNIDRGKYQEIRIAFRWYAKFQNDEQVFKNQLCKIIYQLIQK